MWLDWLIDEEERERRRQNGGLDFTMEEATPLAAPAVAPPPPPAPPVLPGGMPLRLAAQAPPVAGASPPTPYASQMQQFVPTHPGSLVSRPVFMDPGMGGAIAPPTQPEPLMPEVSYTPQLGAEIGVADFQDQAPILGDQVAEDDISQKTSRQLAEETVSLQGEGPKKGFFREMFEAMLASMGNGRGAIYNMLDYGTGKAQEREREAKTQMYEAQFGRKRAEQRQMRADQLDEFKTRASYDLGSQRIAQQDREAMLRHAEFVADQGSDLAKEAMKLYWAKDKQIPKSFQGLDPWMYDVVPTPGWNYHISNDRMVRTRGSATGGPDDVEVEHFPGAGGSAKEPQAAQVGDEAEADADRYIATPAGNEEIRKEIYSRLPRANPKWGRLTDDASVQAHIADLQARAEKASEKILSQGQRNVELDAILDELKRLQDTYASLEDEARKTVKGRRQSSRAASEWKRPRPGAASGSGPGTFGGTGLPTNGYER